MIEKEGPLTEGRVPRARVVLMCHSIGPYHAARFRAFTRKCPDTLVVELARSQSINPWERSSDEGFQRLTLSLGVLEDEQGATLTHRVLEVLNVASPGAVMTVGYADPQMRAVTRWARRHGRFSAMVTDTWQERRHRWGLAERVKGAWCRWAYDAVFISGQRGADYFGDLGVPEKRLWRGCSVVDNEHFRVLAGRARKDPERVRQSLHLPSKYFVCVARFAAEKNQKGLLDAFHEYRRRGGEWSLVLVGAGPDRGSLEQEIARRGIAGVSVMGWQTYGVLPQVLGVAGALVLPSVREPWGLVVNEAMACGLPVVVSRSCGCAPELCWRGINGWDFDPDDPKELSAILMLLSGRSETDGRFERCSEQIVSSFAPERWAQVLAALLPS